MARKPRLHVSGALYHVILRGNAQQDIFFSSHDRHFFYQLLTEGVARFAYRVHAFCLMTNHVHLALQVGDRALSVGMQNLAFRYTRYVNHQQKRVGHLFQGRFKAFLVDADGYGLALLRYIHLNPVRAKLVRHPADYTWSSHRAYLGVATLPWLTTDWALGQFAMSASAARRRFARFVEDGLSEGHQQLFYGGEADSRVVGEEDFVRSLVKANSSHVRKPTLEEILVYVCKGYSMTIDGMLTEGRTRQRAEARALVAWLATRSGCASLTSIAEYLGRDISTVGHAVSRLEERSRKDRAFANALDRHLAQLTK